MLNVILFGAPGAGKGTQAQMLSEKYCLKHISTGEVIRKEIKSGSKIGASIEEHIAHGELAPDQLVIDMITEYVGKNNGNKGNIFDGFPRTTIQAVEFDKLMEKHGIPVDVMISLEVPDDELVRRLLIRGKDSGRPEDVDEEVIRNRLKIYKETTAIVTKHYAAQNKHVSIDGVGEVDEVFERLCNELDKHLKHHCKAE